MFIYFNSSKPHINSTKKKLPLSHLTNEKIKTEREHSLCSRKNEESKKFEFWTPIRTGLTAIWGKWLKLFKPLFL